MCSKATEENRWNLDGKQQTCEVGFMNHQRRQDEMASLKLFRKISVLYREGSKQEAIQPVNQHPQCVGHCLDDSHEKNKMYVVITKSM